MPGLGVLHDWPQTLSFEVFWFVVCLAMLVFAISKPPNSHPKSGGEVIFQRPFSHQSGGLRSCDISIRKGKHGIFWKTCHKWWLGQYEWTPEYTESRSYVLRVSCHRLRCSCILMWVSIRVMFMLPPRVEQKLKPWCLLTFPRLDVTFYWIAISLNWWIPVQTPVLEWASCWLLCGNRRSCIHWWKNPI